MLFLERDVPWYASSRDEPAPPGCRTELYGSLEELRERFEADVREADLVVVGSYVLDGIDVAAWALSEASGATAFYDIDTPVTVAALERGACEYLSPPLVSRFDLYLSFTGGPLLRRLEQRLGARQAVAFHCLVDPERYFPEPAEQRYALGYLGTYGADRQPALERLLVEPARRLPLERFAVAGPQYPQELEWPENVERMEHLPPASHRAFYAAQRSTLNVTRADMVRAGFSPSVRLFEAAACGVPVISDRWPGIETFFTPGREILLAASAADVLGILRETDAEERALIGERARRRVLAEHTSDHRAEELERRVHALAGARAA